MGLGFRVWILAAVAWPALGQSNLEAVDVYLSSRDDSEQLLKPGKVPAAAIFRRIGVRVTWQSGERPVGQAGIGIRTAERAPASATPYALASTQFGSSSGAEITVYRDRVRRFLTAHYNLPARLAIGYVLAHELAHAIERVDRHSASGIMKEDWSPGDYSEMFFGQLKFADSDVELIRQGLAAR